MILIILIVIVTILLFCKNDNTPSFFGGGSKKNKKIHIVNLNKEKSVELLAYMAIEYAITERQMNREMLEDSSYRPNHNIVNVIHKKKIVNFSCIYNSKVSSNCFDSIVDYNNDFARFTASHYFSTQIDCRRANLRSWLSKYIK